MSVIIEGPCICSGYRVLYRIDKSEPGVERHYCSKCGRLKSVQYDDPRRKVPWLKRLLWVYGSERERH